MVKNIIIEVIILLINFMFILAINILLKQDLEKISDPEEKKKKRRSLMFRYFMTLFMMNAGVFWALYYLGAFASISIVSSDVLGVWATFLLLFGIYSVSLGYQTWKVFAAVLIVLLAFYGFGVIGFDALFAGKIVVGCILIAISYLIGFGSLTKLGFIKFNKQAT